MSTLDLFTAAKAPGSPLAAVPAPDLRTYQAEACDAVEAPPAERWRPVPGFPRYEASDAGRVRSATRAWRAGEPRVLRARVGSAGYERVVLYRGGRPSPATVHRLVLESFVGPCPNGMEACHRNGNRRDNRLANLRWDTHAANCQDSIRLDTHARGSRNAKAVLTEAIVAAARAANMTSEEVHVRWGIGMGSAWRMLTRRTWRHVP